jgi:hypothetical protein
MSSEAAEIQWYYTTIYFTPNYGDLKRPAWRLTTEKV